MNRGAIRDLVRHYIDEPVQANWSDDELNVYIDIEYDELAWELLNKSAGFYWKSDTITSVVGVATLDLPTDCIGVVERIVDSDGSMLRKGRRYDFDITTSGTPSWFDIAGETIIFNVKPTAAETYTIWYFYTPASLDEDGDVPDIPTQFHSLIAYGTIISAKIKDGDDLMSIGTKYAKIKDKMFRYAKERYSGEPRYVHRGSGNYGYKEIE